MVCSVIGLGKSAEGYENKGEQAIGVNDAYKIYPVDYLICVDPPVRFNKKRLATIRNSSPIEFLSHYSEWASFMPMFRQIKLAPIRFDLRYLDSDLYCYSDNSPFVAVVHAYKMGASEIVMYGVDFVDHPALNKDEHHNKRILKMYFELSKELARRNVKLYVSSNLSLLSQVLPIYAKR